MILAIHGHPKGSGTGLVLLEEAVSALEAEGVETTIIGVSDYRVRGCAGCNLCDAGDGCRIHDSMWEIYPLLARCEGIIVSTPVFFGGPPAELKAWIDRCNPFWKDRKVLQQNVRPRRPGALIATAGSTMSTAFLGVIETVRAFFCTLGVDFAAQLLIGGLDHASGEHPTAEQRERARGIGKKIAELRNAEPAILERPWWDHPPE